MSDPMTGKEVDERIEEIILEIDKLRGPALYRAKQKLRALRRDIKKDFQRRDLELMAATDQQLGLL